ncbi:MarR family transcriptional regulator [Catellatospora bangladeshensis]|uniref:HTH iclR-type domain-containing protein n=1 Tax=Catellatospora bangladeshensis TaxID=310355 RepID=A0A8J3NH62_9ACTN|nr:MarR family transcriptional regulator [Catellatospora bangladeshensis]GIF80922.1 hypothetical protein Cba03nite_22710 [Catellatospora bangladeshensis]
MQFDLSTLTPAQREVFEAVHFLGQGNAIELMEQSGKARSTVDKALKTLADLGLIVPVDTDADPAEGVPTRWTMAEAVADSVTAQDNLDDTDTAGTTEHDLVNDETGQLQADEPQPGTPGDTDPADLGDQDGTAEAEDNDEQPVGTSDADVNDQTESGTDDEDEDDDSDTESDEDEEDEDDDSDDDEDTESEGQPARAAVTVVQPSRPGDRKIMTIKAVIAEYGDDGATLDEIVNESGIGHPTASRLLAAMEQADAARRLPGTPGRWIAGPTKASEVDPNPEPPRCPVCFQVVKGVTESPEAVAGVQSLIRPDGTIHVVAEDGTAHVVKLPKRLPPRTASTATAGAVRRTDLTVNGDGNQPFAKGELERLTMAVLSGQPGREMTPQEIATEISAQLNGRAVSSGAVRNNCTKLGSAGRILLVREAPLTFVYPAPAGDSEADEAETTTAPAQADATAEDTSGNEQS